MKICFHVDELERWKTCFANIKNTLNYCDDKDTGCDVVVIANSEAVDDLAQSKTNEDQQHLIQDLVSKGVKIAACRNALAARDIEIADLIPGVDTVPAGIIALTEKQQEGYAYIRP